MIWISVWIQRYHSSHWFALWTLRRSLSAVGTCTVSRWTRDILYQWSRIPRNCISVKFSNLFQQQLTSNTRKDSSRNRNSTCWRMLRNCPPMLIKYSSSSKEINGASNEEIYQLLFVIFFVLLIVRSFIFDWEFQ